MEEEIEVLNGEKSRPKVILTNQEKEQIKSAEKNIIAGGIAGSIGKTATAPFARLTVLYQVSSLLKSQKSSTPTNVHIGDSLWQSIRNIVKQEGFFSLWKGNFTAVIHRFPFSALNFATFEAVKSNYLRIYPSASDSTFLKLSCGAVAGAFSCLVCYPLDLVRVRLTVGGDAAPLPQTSSPKQKPKLGSKIFHTMVNIIQKDGFVGLYHGLTASLLVSIPNYALSFTVYGQVKQQILKRHKTSILVNQQTGHLSAIGSLVSGSMSGIASALFLFPLDVIRKRMQVMGLTTGDNNYRVGAKGLLDHARSIFAHDGFRGFYRGLLPEIMKVCPMVAVTFCSYELTKDFLDEFFP